MSADPTVLAAAARLGAWGFAVSVTDRGLLDSFERAYHELKRSEPRQITGERLARALLAEPDEAVIECRCALRGGCPRPIEEAIACRVCPFKFRCPCCRARRGQRCQRPSGHSGPFVAPHGARLDLADREALERFPYLRASHHGPRAAAEQLALEL